MAITLRGNGDSDFSNGIDISGTDIELNDDGTANFTGNVDIGGGNITLRSDGWTEFSKADTGVVKIANDSNTWAQQIVDSDDNRMIGLGWDGSAFFNDVIRVNQNTTDEPGNGNTTIGLGIGNPDGAIFASSNNISGWNTQRQDGVTIVFRRGGNDGGNISTAGSLQTSYNVGSDYRLKTNIAPLTNVTERFKRLKPCTYNPIAAPEYTLEGFLAHEAQEVIPQCVTGTKDELTRSGEPKMQSIDHSKMVPLLTAALQEAITRIETLESRLSTLEGGNNP